MLFFEHFWSFGWHFYFWHTFLFCLLTSIQDCLLCIYELLSPIYNCLLCIYELLTISFYIFACSSLCVYKLNIVESICVYWNNITKHFYFCFCFFFFFSFSTFLYININAMKMLCAFKNFMIKCLFWLQLWN